MTKSERFSIIERKLLSRRAVSFAELLQSLEVSRATLYRDIKDLRERMNVPIVYDRDTSTYRIDNRVERYELPGVWFSASEIYALLSMQHLLTAFDTSGFLAEHIGPLRQRLLRLLESKSDSAEEVSRRIRIISLATRHYAPRHFKTIALATLERRRLHLCYLAHGSGEVSEREVSPQSLTHYRDNWYLDAWCHLRGALRKLAIDAVKEVKILDTPAQDMDAAQLETALAAGYGIFAGAAVQWATLRFTAERARWVASEAWHSQQQGEFLPDGRYQLRVPYSKDPELIMDILKYGPECEVMAPAELRVKVGGLFKAAAGRYGNA